jgi:thiol-disulfide isomerase/thioredoxin
MRRARYALAAAAGLLLAATGCTSLQGTGDKGYVSGDGAIRQIAVADRGDPVALSGKDLDGRPLSLASMRGKPTVVNVWGAWCADCHAESPYVVAAAKELGVTAHFVGIDSRDSGTSQGKSFESRYGLTWPSLYSPGGEALLSFPGVITPNSVPATVVLDAQGRPAAAINGAVPSTRTLVEMVRQVAQGG